MMAQTLCHKQVAGPMVADGERCRIRIAPPLSTSSSNEALSRVRRAGTLNVLVTFLMALAASCAFADQSSASGAPSSPQAASAGASSREPFALALGVAFSTAMTNSTLVAGGLEYGFPSQGSTGFPLLYVDLRTSVDFFNDISAGSVGVGYSTESLSRQNIYAGLGLGYSYVYVKKFSCGSCVPTPPRPPYCVDSCGGSTATLGSGVGGKVFVGFDASRGFGLEGSYDISPSVAQTNTSAVVLRLKYRFK